MLAEGGDELGGERDEVGRDLDIPARMHDQRWMDRGWILGRLRHRRATGK